uniref:SAYSvFN domain-containing protein n=1 Tax=Musca domestica TaxID=7370 RepID=A0A1I8ML64_MUSDO
METTEERLQKYRLKKRREEHLQRFIAKFWEIISPTKGVKEEVNISSKTALQHSENSLVKNIELVSENRDFSSCLRTVDATLKTRTLSDAILRYLLHGAYISLWIILYIIAIELQFGIVYLMLSGLLIMYINTRTGPKSRNEISAYSVFNKDFKSIDGSLKAEQFEREIGIR